jgi:hypothetical protein
MGDAFFGMTFFAGPGQDKAVALATRRVRQTMHSVLYRKLVAPPNRLY